MPAGLQPPPHQHESDNLVRDRSPHPYLRNQRSLDGQDGEHGRSAPTVLVEGGKLEDEIRDTPQTPPSTSRDGTASESGTEADDERPHLLKALPPATYRPRKGLKHTDGTVSPLLTPSQLDLQGRKLSQGYFDPFSLGKRAQSPDEEHLRLERQKFEARRRAERIRRLSEGLLVAVIGIVVGCGPQVFADAWQWSPEIMSHAITVAGLIAVYPLRLLFHSSSSGRIDLRFWKRFRIPPSFDPASVLYPTFLPVLVALSLLPQLPALLLPNLMLGLASLPPRLFPSLSRAVNLNSIHWMISLVPLIVTQKVKPLLPRLPFASLGVDLLETSHLGPETLIYLFPLHQCLLPPLDYLTATSLLPAEKQLMATTLIDLLLFACSPQAVILHAVLWIGGVNILATCLYILRWNVALARVPSWRFRGNQGRKSRSALAVIGSDILALLQSFRGQIDPSSQVDSDGDDDQPLVPPSRRTVRSPSLRITPTLSNGQHQEPKSAIEQAINGNKKPWDGEGAGFRRSVKRRNTIATLAETTSLYKDEQTRQRSRSRKQDWLLSLGPKEARLRKQLYAAYIYICIIGVIFVPVRHVVSKYALKGAEPVSWALDYLFGDLWALYGQGLSLGDFVPTALYAWIHDTLADYQSIPQLAADIGASNARLVLIAYWVLVLSVGLLAVLLLSAHVEVDTRRKIFHGIMVTMLLPSTFVDPCFCALALSIVLGVFLILEVIRAGQVPPLGSAIGRFVAPYVDGRDLRGPVVVSHVFLLIGCAVPLWLSLGSFDRSATGKWAGWETSGEKREVAMVAGVVCVGMGDAAASLIGRRYGRRKWPWIGGKSLEGSAAFALAVTIGLMAAKVWLRFGGWPEVQRDHRAGPKHWATDVAKAWFSGCGASFMEAVLTGANDNVVVPIALWLLVRGMDL